MREKRRDLVDYAPRFGVTVFVLTGTRSSLCPSHSVHYTSLARGQRLVMTRRRSIGKPSLLCLEGEARAIDRYMAAIKSDSRSDIPSPPKEGVSSSRTTSSSQEADDGRSQKDCDERFQQREMGGSGI